MPRYFTHYWRNTSVDEYIRIHGHDPEVDTVYGDDKLLNVRTGDYLYEVTAREGVLYLLGRLEIRAAGQRENFDIFPGEEAVEGAVDCQAEAFAPMTLHTDNVVAPELTRQIACITKDGVKPLRFTPEGGLDRQTLRVVRELTEASAALLDRIIAEYEENRVSDDDVQCSLEEIEARQAEEGGHEGKQSIRLVNRYERNARLRAVAIRIHGTRCQACGFSFKDMYGEQGVDYIEVHHKQPISTYGGDIPVNPLRDMAVLCSNCHRMIHRNPSAPLSVEELRALVASTHYERTGKSQRL